MLQQLTQKKQKKNKYPQLNVLWVGIFADILGFSFMVSLLPAVKSFFNTTSFQATLLLSSNAFFGIIFGPIWGKLSDKFGRKPTLLICQFGTFASFLLFALTKNFNLLLLSRILDGVFGGNFLIANAIIGDVVEKKDRIVFMGNISLVFALSNILGPGMSALLLSLSNSLLLPGLFGMVLSGISIGCTIFLLKETHPRDHRVSEEAISFDASFAKNQPNQPNHPKQPLPKIRLLEWAFFTLALTLIYSSISLFAFDKFQLSIESLGLLLMIAGILQILFRCTLFLPIIRKLGEKRASLGGLILSAVIYFSIAIINQKWQLIAVILFQGIAASLVRSVLSAEISNAVESDQQGKTQGFKSALDSLGQLFGPFIGGILLSYAPLPFFGLTAGVIVLGSLIVAFFLHRKNAKLISDAV